MSTDWKALCKELLQAIDNLPWQYDWKGNLVGPLAEIDEAPFDRARAALAQPELEGRTDEALACFTEWFCRNYPGPDTIIHKPEWHAPKIFRAAAGAITRYAHPTPQPVPVAERLPEVGGAVKSQWQLIETAPKDGTDVLVLLDCNGQPVVHIAWWRSREEWESSGQYCGGWDSVEDWEGWWSYTRNSMTQEKLDGYQLPTHWMPLPQEPEPPQ